MNIEHDQNRKDPDHDRMMRPEWFILVMVLILVGVVAISFSFRQPTVPEFGWNLSTEDDSVYIERKSMVATQLISRDIRNEEVLDVLSVIKRQNFLPEEKVEFAYRDSSVMLPSQRMIPSPYIVALIAQLAEFNDDDDILMINVGSGYMAAVFSELGGRVFAIEIEKKIARDARTILRREGFKDVFVTVGDGFYGWKDESPFDVIIVTGSVQYVSPHLMQQLAPGGKLIIPVGDTDRIHKLRLYTKEGGISSYTDIKDVDFQPLSGDSLNFIPTYVLEELNKTLENQTAEIEGEI